MERYTVYEGFMDELRNKIAKIERRCAKLGCEFHYAEVGEEYREIIDETNRMHICKFVIVEAEGTAQINGWEFVASVEHTDKGNIYGKAMTEVEIPAQYRCSDPYCEHCKTNRIRKYTYIVRNVENHEFKQIGKACLKDYTNGMSAEIAAMYASLRDVFEEAQERRPSSGMIRNSYIKTADAVRYVAETVRHFGYEKADGIRPTKDRAKLYYRIGTDDYKNINSKVVEAAKQEMESVRFNADSEYAVETAKAALAWIAEQDDFSDYMHNLKVVTSMEYIKSDRFGILASLIPAYNKAKGIEEARKAERQASNWIGNVGKKIDIDVEKAECVSSWESEYNYHYVTTYIYKFFDANGNILIWKTNKSIDLDNVKNIKGTVKELGEFRGIKQTVLTRCKVDA